MTTLSRRETMVAAPSLPRHRLPDAPRMPQDAREGGPAEEEGSPGGLGAPRRRRGVSGLLSPLDRILRSKLSATDTPTVINVSRGRRDSNKVTIRSVDRPRAQSNARYAPIAGRLVPTTTVLE